MTCIGSIEGTSVTVDYLVSRFVVGTKRSLLLLVEV